MSVVKFLIDVALFGVKSVDDPLQFVPRRSAMRNGQLSSTIASSSETSSICSSRSAVQPSSDAGTDDEQMATLRPSSRRGFDIDLSGLEETTVDSDDEDISSVNTEVVMSCR